MKIMSVVGARPNFMKIAPFIHAIDRHNQYAGEDARIDHILVHTGQHYDDSMSKTFFEKLNIPSADINLEVGSGTHAEQIARTMRAFEPVLLKHDPDWVVVVGDVNATSACSQVAKKYGTLIAHIESGLRSFDMGMPEEVNRVITDRLSDLLLAPDRMSCENLRREGASEKSIALVGNIMIDTLDAQIERAKLFDPVLFINEKLFDGQAKIEHIDDEPLALVTIHRPSNIDQEEVMGKIVDWLIDDVTGDARVVWPVHPRAEKMLKEFELWDGLIESTRVILTKPLGYHELLRLNNSARVMITDSGGLQEECCVLGTPAVVLRENTERPITLRENGGTCILAGNDIASIKEKYHEALQMTRCPQRPELWDGHTAKRCVDAILAQIIR